MPRRLVSWGRRVLAAGDLARAVARRDIARALIAVGDLRAG